MTTESMLQDTLNKGFKLFKKQYVAPIAILENKGAIESLKKSARIAQDNLGFSIIFGIFVSIIDGIGGALRLGWFVSHPYTVLCTCIAAEKLSKEK